MRWRLFRKYTEREIMMEALRECSALVGAFGMDNAAAAGLFYTMFQIHMNAGQPGCIPESLGDLYKKLGMKS